MALQLPAVAQHTGSFESYLKYVNSIPILDDEKERMLFKAYQQKNDLSAVQQIVLSHLRFVAYIAKSFRGYGLPIEDLVQEGTIGLMKSVKKFNLDFGVRLSSFAVYYIKAEIQEYVICNWRLVKTATTKARRKLFFNLKKLKNKIEWMTYENKKEVAKELGVSEEDVTDMEVQLAQPDVYINSAADDDGDSNSVYIDSLLEDKSEHFTTKLMQQDHRDKSLAKVQLLVEKLDNRSRDIIENRWLCSEKLPHRYFSEKYCVSQERIRQIEEKALNTLRKKLYAINN